MCVKQSDVGLGVPIILIPFDAGRHRKQLFDGYVIIRRALQIRDIGRNLVIDAFDIAVFYRRTDQSGGE